MRRIFACLIVLGIFFVATSVGIYAKAPVEKFDFLDECNDIATYWSGPSPTNSENLFIIGPGQTVENEGVPEGEYRFVGKKASATYTRIYTELSTGYGSWTLEFSAKFTELPTVDSLGIAGYRGLSMTIWRSNGNSPATAYVIGFSDRIIGVVGSSEGFIQVAPSVVGAEKEFHTWRIVFDFKDRESTMTFFKDGKEVAKFTNVRGEAISVVTEGRINLQNVPLNLDPYGDDLDVYLDYIAFRKDK